MPNFAALRAAVFQLSTKTLRGDIRPPVGAWVKAELIGTDWLKTGASPRVAVLQDKDAFLG